MATTKKLMGTTAAAGGGGPLAIEDVFSTYLYTGNDGTQVIENGINLGQSYGSGGLELYDGPSGNTSSNPAGLDFTFSPTVNVNDFTIEGNLYVVDGADGFSFGSLNAYDTGVDIRLGVGGTYAINVYLKSASPVQGGSALLEGQWYHIAVVRSGTDLYLYINGSRVATGTVDGTTIVLSNGSVGGVTAGAIYNARKYLSNYRVSNVARYTGASFTAPTSNFASDANTLILTCQGDSPLVDNSSYGVTLTPDTAGTGVVTAKTFGPFDAATAGEGGMVWIKNRSGAVSHALFDTERGTNVLLRSQDTDAEFTSAGSLTSFNSNGFSLGSSLFVNSSVYQNYASWTFRKAPRFFDVVTYTGDGTSNRQIAHNLGTEVGSIFVKRLDSALDWRVYHRELDSTSPANYYLVLNSTAARTAVGTGQWQQTTPTSTYFTVGNNDWVNASGGTYVAYLFAHDPLGPSGDGSDGLIACGSYTGNGSSQDIDIGWEPQWLLIKDTTTSGTSWVMLDNMRGIFTNGSTGSDPTLFANATNAESLNQRVDLHARGFSPQVAGVVNINAANYIYIAIRRGPMRQPTSGTEVFDTQLWTGNTTTLTDTRVLGGISDYPTDLFIGTERVDSNSHSYFYDRIRGLPFLTAVGTNAEDSTYTVNFDYQSGVRLNQYGLNYLNRTYAGWNFRRAPGFFDAVAYTGNGVAGRTVPHNLGVAPEMMIVKRRDGVSSWITYWESLGATKGLFMDTNTPFTSNTYWNDTAPTDSVFSLGSGSTNTSSATFISYLFATLPGVSKVGSYTGNGSSQTIDCGFTSGARFVLIKRTDSTGDWYVWDTARGIVAANDPHLSLNTTAAEVTTDDSVDPDNSGFIVNQVSATNINVSSASYIYLAVS